MLYGSYTLCRKFSTFQVLGIQFQDYSVRLDNNIAIVTLATNIIFNDFIQPACLPGNDASIYGKIGKVCNYFYTTK